MLLTNVVFADNGGSGIAVSTTPLIDAGDPTIFDASPSDIGAYGGPN